MSNRFIPIGELFNLKKGELQSTKCIPGEYDFITAAEDWKTHHEYDYECEALIIAVAASGSLGRTHYVNGKFISSDLCFILTPREPEKYPLNLAFYHFVFNSLRPILVATIKSGTSKESINKANLKKYELPYFNIERQNLWIEKLKNTLVGKDLLGAEITHQQTLLKKLRQQILQEAIEGKLTQDWRAENIPSPLHGTPPYQGESSTIPPLTRGGAEGGGVKNQNSPHSKRRGTLNNLPHLKTFRKSLRKNLTPAEAKLWTLLKGKQLNGRKFRRQHSVANYILDFYCPSENLAIELDGEVHNHSQAAEYDRDRDAFLAYTGIKVMRFENKLVFENPDGLLACVEQEFNNPYAYPSAYPSAPAGHLPLSGEELFSSPPDKGESRIAGRGFETADELLKHIQAEKIQLIKEGKIKKQKPLPPISEAEKPFELPDGWAFTYLFNSSINKDEFRIPITKLDRNRREKIYDYYGASGVIDKIDDFTHEGRHLLIGEDGANLISRSTPIAFFADGKFWVNNHAHVLATVNAITLDYLKTHINAIDLKPYISGGFQPKLSQSNLNRIIIAFPPLPEQKAIVTKVEKLLALCDKLENQITQNQTHAEQLMQAVLKEAFSQSKVSAEQVVASC